MRLTTLENAEHPISTPKLMCKKTLRQLLIIGDHLSAYLG